MIKKSHYYFNLNESSWPLMISFSLFNLLFSLILYFKFLNMNLLILSLLSLLMWSYVWWGGYAMEFNLQGKNSLNLEKGIKMSMVLFILSEIFFFFSFFWSYFHFMLSPTNEMGMNWPPKNIESFNCLNVPLINTLILMTSGVTITISHNNLMKKKNKMVSLFLLMTISLGLIFTFLQLIEYKSSFFCLSDSSYGSSFFILTGFHGLHVLVGSIFLLTTMIKSVQINLTFKNFLSFELASWYWHFVDVVWLFLYFFLYFLNN